MAVTAFAQHGLVRMAYEVTGEGPAVVLLHGLLGDRVSVRPLADALVHDHTVLSIDLRGHGGSSAVHGVQMTLADAAEDVIAVMDAAEIEQATIVGVDIGAEIASLLGDRAISVIAINPMVELAAEESVLEAIADDAYKGLGEKSVHGWLNAAWGDDWSERVPKPRIAAARRNAAALHPYLTALLAESSIASSEGAIRLPGGTPFADEAAVQHVLAKVSGSA